MRTEDEIKAMRDKFETILNSGEDVTGEEQAIVDALDWALGDTDDSMLEGWLPV